jgi:hypothetical protein
MFVANDSKNQWKYIEKIEKFLFRLVMKTVSLHFETLDVKYTFVHLRCLKNLKFEIHDIFEYGIWIL